MKTTLTNTLTALSAALLLSFTLASCAGSAGRAAGGGWHNMGVGPKDSMPMPDANMPGKRSSKAKPLHNTASGWHNMGVGPKDNMPMPDANMPGRR